MKPSSRSALADRPNATDDWPLPTAGVSVTHLLIVRDIARARQFYAGVLGAHVLSGGSPTLLRFYNTFRTFMRTRTAWRTPRTVRRAVGAR
jgi:hypothetical protein